MLYWNVNHKICIEVSGVGLQRKTLIAFQRVLANELLTLLRVGVEFTRILLLIILSRVQVGLLPFAIFWISVEIKPLCLWAWSSEVVVQGKTFVVQNAHILLWERQWGMIFWESSNWESKYDSRGKFYGTWVHHRSDLKPLENTENNICTIKTRVLLF